MFFRKQLKAETPRPLSALVNEDNDTRAKRTDVLARTIWGEARGEPLSGKEAVANVILNRLKTAQRRGKFWWGNTIEEICMKPYQFSCWNKNDPNFFKVNAVNEEDAQFSICLRIARRALNGVLPDLTYGADHYHAGNVAPKWAESRAPVATIGGHVFYCLEG